MHKKLRKSSRGLTFSIDDNNLIGTKYRYFIDKKKKNIIIVPDDQGNMTVSRKRSGKRFKALYDIRSKEVKELCSTADYLEVEITKDKIIVHTYKNIKERVKSNIIRLEDILEKTGEIVLSKAVGFDNTSTLESSKTFTSDLTHIYNVASLFSGAGLLDYSFSKDDRFDIVYGVDFDKNACMTYKENIGEHIVCKDIRQVLPEEIPEELHKFKKSTHSNTYRRLSWNELSPTITNWRKTNLLHPEENRILTVSEASAIMGLDKDFKVMGNTLNSRQQQIGNGVTQAISRYIKKCVLSILDENKNIICFG